MISLHVVKTKHWPKPLDASIVSIESLVSKTRNISKEELVNFIFFTFGQLWATVSRSGRLRTHSNSGCFRFSCFTFFFFLSMFCGILTVALSVVVASPNYNMFWSWSNPMGVDFHCREAKAQLESVYRSEVQTLFLGKIIRGRWWLLWDSTNQAWRIWRAP